MDREVTGEFHVRDEAPPPDRGEEWRDDGRVDRKRPGKASRPKGRGSVELDLGWLGALPERDRPWAEREVRAAANAFSDERFADADKRMAEVLRRHPSVPEVRELGGLIAYRLGRWEQAIRHLELFGEATGSTEQHPVLADAHRALGHHDQVADLWDELREAGDEAEVMVEGRIVAAGSLADQGRLADGIRLLEKGPTRPNVPHPWTLRLWYALADLQERAGDVPAARRTFGLVVQADARFADAERRLDALS